MSFNEPSAERAARRAAYATRFTRQRERDPNMKITIESTPELAHANGLPVRVWTGTAERGTPLLVLVTRVAAPDDGHPDDLAEIRAALTEPPTRHGVYGETPVVAEPRWCNACRARHSIRKPALFVARDSEGLEWFECDAHDPTDNLAETVRVVREPIGEWFDRHELPLPGGVYRGPASQREPWASMLARAPSDEWCCSCGAGNDAKGYAHLATCMLQRALRAERLAQRAEPELAARLRVAMAICDGLEPQLADPFHCAINRIRLLLAEPEQREPSAAETHATEVLRDALHRAADAKVAQLASECRSLRERLKDRDKPWLVKDFWSLYRAAAAAVSGETPDSRGWLELQLARLRPAFDVCESERHGAPDRLTTGERFALDGLHRWLHSPGGDCELTEAAQPYHDQVEVESAGSCDRLEAEEQRAYAGVHIPRLMPLTDAAHAALDSLVRVSEALVVCDGLEPQLEDPFHCAVRAIRAALVGAPRLNTSPLRERRIRQAEAALAMARHDEREKERACYVVEPPLPHAVITAIVVDDRAGEQQTGSAFVLAAMRGAQLGWHAKHAHPETTALKGRLGAPIDEPARSAWLTGFRLGAGLDPAADLSADETPEAPKASTPGVCRVCKCTDDDCSQCIAKTGEPCHWVERDLCSACDTAAAAELRARGLDLAAMNRARLASGMPTISAVQALARLDAAREVLGATAAAPLVLTDELREYAREHLRYRAPEVLTERDRAILALYDAEETERAKSPETWLGGDR
jgi:hypothetical protein